MQLVEDFAINRLKLNPIVVCLSYLTPLLYVYLIFRDILLKKSLPHVMARDRGLPICKQSETIQKEYSSQPSSLPHSFSNLSIQHNYSHFLLQFLLKEKGA